MFLDGAVVKSLNSSDKKVVSVSRNGKVVGKRKGRATITVVDNNGKKYRCKIIVEDPSLNRKKVSLKINQNYRLKLNGNTQKIFWSSNNESVACVNSVAEISLETRRLCKSSMVLLLKVIRHLLHRLG